MRLLAGVPLAAACLVAGHAAAADPPASRRDVLERRRLELRAELDRVERELAALAPPAAEGRTVYLHLRARDAPVPEEARIREVLLEQARGAGLELIPIGARPPPPGAAAVFVGGVRAGLPLLEAALFRTVSGRVHVTYRLVAEDLGEVDRGTIALRPDQLPKRLAAWTRALVDRLARPPAP